MELLLNIDGAQIQKICLHLVLSVKKVCLNFRPRLP
jgi:hypothetical protein